MSAEKKNHDVEAFELSNSEAQPSLAADLWAFLRENKKYWMIPLILSLLLLGVLIAMGGSAVAPFIYPII